MADVGFDRKIPALSFTAGTGGPGWVCHGRIAKDDYIRPVASVGQLRDIFSPSGTSAKFAYKCPDLPAEIWAQVMRHLEPSAKKLGFGELAALRLVSKAHYDSVTRATAGVDELVSRRASDFLEPRIKELRGIPWLRHAEWKVYKKTFPGKDFGDSLYYWFPRHFEYLTCSERFRGIIWEVWEKIYCQAIYPLQASAEKVAQQYGLAAAASAVTTGEVLPDSLPIFQYVDELSVDAWLYADNGESLHRLLMLMKAARNLKSIKLNWRHFAPEMSENRDIFEQFRRLRKVSVETHNGREYVLPAWFGELQNLSELRLSTHTLRCAIPDHLSQMSKSLKSLDVEFTDLGPAPDWLGKFQNLIELRLHHTELKQIPSCLLGLKNTLRLLDVSSNNIKELPDWLGDLQRLQVLNLNDTKISKFPLCIRNLGEELTCLNMSNNDITEIPTWLGNFPRLKSLYVYRTLLPVASRQRENGRDGCCDFPPWLHVFKNPIFCRNTSWRMGRMEPDAPLERPSWANSGERAVTVFFEPKNR